MSHVSWQPKINTTRETIALEALREHLCARDDAETVRHALRMFVALSRIMEDSTLAYVDQQGALQGSEPLPRGVFGEEQRSVHEKVHDRRWTVKFGEVDQERAAEAMKWLKTTIRRDMLSTVIIRIGELVDETASGLTLWVEGPEGGYTLVVL